MAECEVCNVCGTPGKFANASEVAEVACNVRAFGNEIFTFWRCPSCQSLHCREDADLDHYYRSYPVKGHVLAPSGRAPPTRIF